jgi:hypothetical protein
MRNHVSLGFVGRMEAHIGKELLKYGIDIGDTTTQTVVIRNGNYSGHKLLSFGESNSLAPCRIPITTLPLFTLQNTELFSTWRHPSRCTG